MKKQIIIGICILIILILLPFAINYFIQKPAKFDVVGEPVNWLMFWPTYISAVASFLMIYVTYLSLRQNREQLEEMRRQWKEDREKKLVAFLVVHDGYYHLCIKNTSIVPIINIRASLTHYPSGAHQPSVEFLNYFDHSEFSIEAGGSRYINTHVPDSCPAGYSINSNEYDADDYLGLTLAFDKDKEKDKEDTKDLSFNLSFNFGKILKDELKERDKKR